MLGTKLCCVHCEAIFLFHYILTLLGIGGEEEKLTPFTGAKICVHFFIVHNIISLL